jgi:hypothetical protein
MSDERKVQEVLARYVRAADSRDGAAQGSLFTDDAGAGPPQAAGNPALRQLLSFATAISHDVQCAV